MRGRIDEQTTETGAAFGAVTSKTSRRGLLRAVVGTAAALIGAGAFLSKRTTAEAASTVTYTATGSTNVAIEGDGTSGATGVLATSDTGTGLKAVVGGAEGTTAAVSGANQQGVGVSGFSQTSTGVAGTTSGPNQWAVAGIAFGAGATGVYGEGIESGGPGVHGISDAGVGVLAESGTNYGLDGFSARGTGVRARSGGENGVGLRVEGLLQVIGNAVGQATMAAGVSAVTVSNPAATPSSTILITPLSDPRGRLWVADRAVGSFVIHDSTSAHPDFSVMYLIIN